MAFGITTLLEEPQKRESQQGDDVVLQGGHRRQTQLCERLQLPQRH